jgi:hypothetical protein
MKKGMEVSQKPSFNQRKFVSVGLFFTLAVLVITGVLIQIFETFEEGFSIHFFTAVHVLTGLVFTVLSILHAVINWRSLKAYIQSKELMVSKEAGYAFLLVGLLILIGFFLTCLTDTGLITIFLLAAD